MSQNPAEPSPVDADRSAASVAKAQRFLELVDAISSAHLHLQESMTEKYFRRMVLRMAEHQLVYEEFLASRS
jgi:hypothetical protein